MVSFLPPSRRDRAKRREKRRAQVLEQLGYRPVERKRASLSTEEQYDEKRRSSDGAPALTVPSLLARCATTILENPDLLGHLQQFTPFSTSDIFQILQDASGREYKGIEMFTVNLRGCRLGGSELQTECRRRTSKVQFVVSLCVDDCTNMTDAILLWLTLGGRGAPHKALPLLTHISIRSCPHVTDRAISQIAGVYGDQLQSLNISNTGTTQKSVKAIAASCPVLESLSLSHQLLVRDKHIALLVEGCPELQELDVSYCRRLGPASIESISQGLPYLHTLSLSDVPSISTAVEKLSRLERLTVLRLQNCMLNDSALTRILTGCSHLDSLSLRGCTNLTLGAVRSIAHLTNGIRVLDITACPINGNLALGILATSPAAASLREFSSSQRVIMYCTPETMRLFVN